MASRKMWSLSLAIVLAAGVAHAAPSSAEREAARHLMDEGKARLKANDVSRAIEAFQQAHEIMHVPTTGMALASAHLSADHLVEARDLALEVSRIPKEPGDPAVFDTARKRAKELEAELTPRIPTVRVKVSGGAVTRLAVDDIEVPSSAIAEPIAVNPGKHVVSARGAEGAEAKAPIELAEGDAKELELSLSGQRAPVVTASKTGASAATAPRTIEGFGNDDAPPSATGQRTTLAQVLMYGGFGIGAVGVTAGIVTGALTYSKASAIEPQCEMGICDPAAKGDLDSANTLATVSTIAFVAGGVGLLAGVIGYFLPRRATTYQAPAAQALPGWAPLRITF